MLQALLLDLDNTLILYDEPAFYVHFFEAIQEWFEDMLPGDQLRRNLGRAMTSLKNGSGETTNQDRFTAGFCENSALSPAVFWDRYVRFYMERYPELPVQIRTPDGLSEVFRFFRGLGLPIVIATNPVFPLEAVRQRISWAGLDPTEFRLITHMENMCFVKPHSGYYRQIAESIGIPEERCLMVGNDPVNDMAAGTVGMNTFLTTDCNTGGGVPISDRNPVYSQTQKLPPAPSFEGQFAEIPEIVTRRMETTATSRR